MTSEVDSEENEARGRIVSCLLAPCIQNASGRAYGKLTTVVIPGKKN